MRSDELTIKGKGLRSEPYPNHQVAEVLMKIIYGKYEGQRWANARVSKTDSDMYPSWSSYPLYSHTVDGIIYGTVDCTDSYVHTSGSYVSIYK